jgi:uncharacterized protein DUF4258
VGKRQPWSAADATNAIRSLARHASLTITLTQHAKDQMLDRDLIVSDVLYVLKHGFVFESAQSSTQKGLFKYLQQGRSPNSGNRTVRVVVIPDPASSWMKVVTVMWVDE